MEEIIVKIIEMVGNNIYELCLGAGIVLTTIFGKPKTAEKLVELKKKSICKKRKKLEKTVAKAEKLGQELSELEKE